MSVAIQCETCDFAAAHGWWGPEMTGKTHCQSCHATWGGMTTAHCTSCHQTFASNGVADKHWLKRGHVHPSEIDGFWQTENGRWHWGRHLPLRPAWSPRGGAETAAEGRDTSPHDLNA